MNQEITIIRKAKKDNYSIISNGYVRNTKLSWKAKGLLTYLLHLPPTWKINIVHLQQQASDGRHSLKQGLKELQEHGYLTHENLREKGKFCGHLWIVHEEPIFDEVNIEKSPQAENPHAVNRHAENRPLVNTKDSESKDSESSITNTKEILAPVGALSADADELTSFFIQKLKERKPDIKLPDKKKWIQEIDRMIRIDGRDPRKIRAMIDWIHRDSFWSSNILSTKKLREQYDQIELQAIRKHTSKNMEKNKEYAITLKQRYPETYKNLLINSKFAISQFSGKELSLELPPDSFKKSLVNMFGIKWDDLNERDRV